MTLPAVRARLTPRAINPRDLYAPRSGRSQCLLVVVLPTGENREVWFDEIGGVCVSASWRATHQSWGGVTWTPPRPIPAPSPRRLLQR